MMIAGGAFAAAAAFLIGFRLTTAVISGQIYPMNTQIIDLRSSGVNSAGEIGRLKHLRQALLSGNAITDASELKGLAECDYIDLTGNPVSAESYAVLRAALPGCVILCEAADNETQFMALGGYPLPGVDSLKRVFASHGALETVDLRETDLSQAETDELRTAFPHISFVSAADGQVSLNAASAELARRALARIPEEKAVKLTGCAFTGEEYRALGGQYPQMELDCPVLLGGKAFSVKSEEIDLRGGQLDEALKENLRLFEGLRKATLDETLPTEAAALKEALGLETVNYLYNGNVIAPETQEIDLYGASGLNAEQLNALLSAASGVQKVTMGMPDEEMLHVIGAYKEKILFVYEVEAFGRKFSTSEEIIDLGDDVEDEDIDELMALIDRMPNLKEAHMYESKLSQESMDLLFDSYPEVFFGWTFRMCKGKYVVRTDITAFCTQLGSPMHTYTQDNFVQLRYCKNLLALDLGHNAITNLEFLTELPHLKLLILGDNDIQDLAPLASLKELEFLELFMNYDLTDFSALSELKLTDLNIRCPGGKHNRVKADAFMSITTLERFWASSNHFNEEEEARLRAALPDCEICVTKDHSTGDDWRGDGRQEIIRRMFDTRIYEPLP